MLLRMVLLMQVIQHLVITLEKFLQFHTLLLFLSVRVLVSTMVGWNMEEVNS